MQREQLGDGMMEIGNEKEVLSVGGGSGRVGGACMRMM